MAAPTCCANCGELFERRKEGQQFCFKPDCRAARNRENVRNWRRAMERREQYKLTRLRRGVAA